MVNCNNTPVPKSWKEVVRRIKDGIIEKEFWESING